MKSFHRLGSKEPEEHGISPADTTALQSEQATRSDAQSHTDETMKSFHRLGSKEPEEHGISPADTTALQSEHEESPTDSPAEATRSDAQSHTDETMKSFHRLGSKEPEEHDEALTRTSDEDTTALKRKSSTESENEQFSKPEGEKEHDEALARTSDEDTTALKRECGFWMSRCCFPHLFAHGMWVCFLTRCSLVPRQVFA
eukprot:Selendium_serpulae@DN2658_c0_g1_i3.p2